MLNVRALRVIRNGILRYYLSDDRVRRCRYSGRQFYRRFLIRNLIGYNMVVTVYDGSWLRLRRRAKGIFERSNENRLLGGRRRVRCGNGGDHRAAGARAWSVRRRTYCDRTGVFTSRTMNTVRQRWRFVSQVGHMIDATYNRGNRVSCR